MSGEDTTVREFLHEQIQGTVGMPSPAGPDDELPEGAMLMGWVVVAEWMSPDGDRWLSKIEGSSSGRRPPEWQVNGYLDNALNRWENVEVDDDGDD